MLACLRKKPEYIKKSPLSSLFNDIYRIDDIIIKVKKDQKGDHGKANDIYQKELRSNLDFLPEYYGTVISSIDDRPVAASFYEYVEPIRRFSVKDVIDISIMMLKTYLKGYRAFDWKHTNFGKKDGKVFYLDERGIGRGVLPPDVSDGIDSFMKLKKEKAREKIKRHKLQAH
jgi:hypothetical protein